MSVNVDDFVPITMEEFLRDFVNIDGYLTNQEIFSISKFSHCDLKSLNIPYIKTVAFEDVTIESILTGEVLIVADGKSKRSKKRYAPYIRPSILKERLSIAESNNKMKVR